jgi:putative hydrolase of the HAD superfamily
VAVFSCQERRKKPAQELYQTVCQWFDCPPAACVSVGDGSDEELTGAQLAGLVPVLKRTDLRDVYDHHRLEVAGWEGHVIHAIHEGPQFLKALGALGQSPS